MADKENKKNAYEKYQEEKAKESAKKSENEKPVLSGDEAKAGHTESSLKLTDQQRNNIQPGSYIVDKDGKLKPNDEATKKRFSGSDE